MRIIPVLLVAALIGGCSPSGSGDSQSTSTQAEQASASQGDAKPQGDKSGADTVKVTLPQLAYAYKLGYLLPGDKMGDAQEAHRALCEQMGPSRCQLLALEHNGGQDVAGEALLRVRVATSEAHAFQQSLDHAVTGFGGRATETNVEAEDVSKDIVDTKARIAQRELLVARLTEVLRKRTGTVAELVEAERSVTQAQEELDQGRAWLTELQGRVAMSNFEIHYSAIAASTSAQSVGGQLGEATEGSAATFLIGVRGLFTLAIYLLPWLLLAFPVVLAVRRLGRKRDAGQPQG